MVRRENGSISFIHSVDGLFNDVGLISAYMTKNLVNEQGSVMDEFIITDDERELFNVCVKKTMPNIFEGMLKISKSVKGFEEKDCNIIFSISDNNTYNENSLSLADATILDCLQFGVLSEFYSMCTNPALQSIASKKYSEAMLLLNNRLFQVKKKAISPLY